MAHCLGVGLPTHGRRSFAGSHTTHSCQRIAAALERAQQRVGAAGADDFTGVSF